MHSLNVCPTQHHQHVVQYRGVQERTRNKAAIVLGRNDDCICLHPIRLVIAPAPLISPSPSSLLNPTPPDIQPAHHVDKPLRHTVVFLAADIFAVIFALSASFWSKPECNAYCWVEGRREGEDDRKNVGRQKYYRVSKRFIDVMCRLNIRWCRIEQGKGGRTDRRSWYNDKPYRVAAKMPIFKAKDTGSLVTGPFRMSSILNIMHTTLGGTHIKRMHAKGTRAHLITNTRALDIIL